MHNIVIAVGLAGIAGTWGGCESGTAQEGIYQVTGQTRSEPCDAAPVNETPFDPFVFVQNQAFFSEEFVAVVGCADPTDCRNLAAEDTLFLGGDNFDQGNDDDGWTGRIVFVSGTSSCVGTVAELRLSFAGGGLRIDRTDTEVMFTPSGGECTTDQTEDEVDAGRGTCSAQVTKTATKTADL